MKATFEKTLEVLVKAYFNNTLLKADPCGCAVGNLVIHGMGYSCAEDLKRNFLPGMDNGNLHSWYEVVKRQLTNEHDHPHIKATGYSVNELYMIERAFEKNGEWYDDQDEKVFKGLMAVVDVLADIHGIDLKSKEEAKALFVKI